MAKNNETNDKITSSNSFLRNFSNILMRILILQLRRALDEKNLTIQLLIYIFLQMASLILQNGRDLPFFSLARKNFLEN